MAAPPPGPTFALEVPFLELLGIRVEACERGRSHLSLPVRPELTNSWHAAHGGVVMALLDTALATAALSLAPEASGAMTVQLSVTFIAGASGSLLAEGRVVRDGRSLVFCEGEVRDATGALVAKGLGTLKLRRPGGPGDGEAGGAAGAA